jgi:hypothetical protein
VVKNAHLVAHLVELRNFQEHPGEKRTIIENFALMPNGHVSEPVWYVSGDEPRSIRDEMLGGAEFLVGIAEEMFIRLVLEAADERYSFTVQRVPNSQLDPAKPIRYRLSINLAKLKAAQKS